MTNTSLWLSLRNPAFRRLWIATVISGVCVSAHDTAATWMMNTLTSSKFLISVMSTVAALPLFFFTLPAGSLADLVDHALQSFGDLTQQRIAGSMPKSVIDTLELIQIDVQQRRVPMTPSRLREHLRQVVMNPFAVRQTG